MCIFVIFSVVGIFLVLFGAIVVVPYTTSEPFRVDGSKIWVDKSFTLQPNSNKNYLFDMVCENISIIQTDIDTAGALVFTIVEDDRDMVVFERHIGGWKVRYFWTPPTGGDFYRFIFDNPYTMPKNVTVKVTEYYPKAVEYKDVTHYTTILDLPYAYAGTIAILVGIGLNLAHAYKKPKQQS